MIVPASDNGKEPTVEFIGAPIAYTKKVVTKKTNKGYNMSRSACAFRNMDEPGWVPGREIRVGAGQRLRQPQHGRKSVLGLWRTALDADKSCISLTRFTLQGRMDRPHRVQVCDRPADATRTPAT